MDPHNNQAIDCDRAAGALRDFYLRSHRVIDRIMSAKGASFARAKILMHIARQGGVRSIDLANLLGYAPRTITEAIDGLERDEFVRREPDPIDRRAKRISLTGAGSAAAAAAESSRLQFVEAVFGVLSAGEQQELIRLVGRLNDRLAELGG